jgi:hypothetical protein
LSHIDRQEQTNPDITITIKSDSFEEEARESTASTVAMLNSATIASIHIQQQQPPMEPSDINVINTSDEEINLNAVKTRLFKDTLKKNNNNNSSKELHSQQPFRVPPPPPLRPYVATSTKEYQQQQPQQSTTTNFRQNRFPTAYSTGSTFHPWLEPINGGNSYLQLLQYSLRSGWHRQQQPYLPTCSHSHTPNRYTIPSSSSRTDMYDNYTNENKDSPIGLSLKITPVKRLYTSQFWKDRLDTRDFTSIISKLL